MGSRRRTLLLGGIALVSATAAVAWFVSSADKTPELPREWTATAMVLAGDGIPSCRDGDAARARFSEPFDVAVAPTGALFVSDGGDAHRIRVISPDGGVATLAGSERGFADGSGNGARFDMPSGIALAGDGTLFVADTGNNAIRRIAPDGRVTTIAGDGEAGYVDGRRQDARFNGPVDVAVDAAGRVIVADTYNDRIRAISPDGTVTTIAGNGVPGFADGDGAEAQFDTPSGVAIDGAGNIVIADTGNSLVRRIDGAGRVSTPDAAAAGGLVRPIGIAAGPRDEIFVTDDRGRILELRRGGDVRTLAGSSPGFRDGEGSTSRFRRPSGVAVAGEGRLVVADAGNALVRLVAARERMSLSLPPPPSVSPRFDEGAFARRPLLWPVHPMDGPHEIAGTMGEARGGEGSERFHAGVDVRVGEGTPVVAVRAGVVTHPLSTGDFGSLNEWLRIGDVAYVHVRAGRVSGDIVDPGRFVATYDERGRIARIRVKRGARFETGDVIATVNQFNHVHLNVGWPGEEHNALRLRLAQFGDRVPPTIARNGVRLFDDDGRRFTERVKGRLMVSGRVHIVADAWDQADGNRPGRRLGLYAVGYRVLKRDGSPVDGLPDTAERIRFDQLAASPEAARLVYAPGSGIPFYGRRVTRFLYIATNTFREGEATAGSWDTTTLPPGDYIVRILAADVSGNVATANRDVPVTVVALP